MAAPHEMRSRVRGALGRPLVHVEARAVEQVPNSGVVAVGPVLANRFRVPVPTSVAECTLGLVLDRHERRVCDEAHRRLP